MKQSSVVAKSVGLYFKCLGFNYWFMVMLAIGISCLISKMGQKYLAHRIVARVKFDNTLWKTHSIVSDT